MKTLAQIENCSDQNTTVQVTPADYVTIRMAAVVTGLTQKAIRRKIEDGKWLEGREFRRSPDGGVFISLKGYCRWVESGRGWRSGPRASA